MRDHHVWLEKARENLTAAQLCCDNALFNACANRAYYAMFQAGAAVLLKHEIAPSGEKIGHEWLQSSFSGYLIHRRKMFSAKFRSYLNDAYWVRVRADYKTEAVPRKVALRQLERAREFVQTLELELPHDAQS